MKSTTGLGVLMVASLLTGPALAAKPVRPLEIVPPYLFDAANVPVGPLVGFGTASPYVGAPILLMKLADYGVFRIQTAGLGADAQFGLVTGRVVYDQPYCPAGREFLFVSPSGSQPNVGGEINTRRYVASPLSGSVPMNPTEIGIFDVISNTSLAFAWSWYADGVCYTETNGQALMQFYPIYKLTAILPLQLTYPLRVDY